MSGVPDIPGETGDQAIAALLHAAGLMSDEEYRAEIKAASGPIFHKYSDTAIGIWSESDVCGWPDDDGPLEDRERHRQWCAAVAKMMAPPKESPERRDLFDPARAVPPPGRYQVEVIARDILRVERGQARGFSFWMRILLGDWDGCELRISFWTADPSGRLDPVVRHDLQIMGAWLAGLGLGPVADELDFIRRIIRKGQQFDQFATLGHKRWRRGLEIYIADIEVRP